MRRACFNGPEPAALTFLMLQTELPVDAEVAILLGEHPKIGGPYVNNCSFFVILQLCPALSHMNKFRACGTGINWSTFSAGTSVFMSTSALVMVVSGGGACISQRTCASPCVKCSPARRQEASRFLIGGPTALAPHFHSNHNLSCA